MSARAINVALAVASAGIISALAITSCDNCSTEGTGWETHAQMLHREHVESEALWNAPCADESTLVATTTGSPNRFKCWNKHHRMRVQVATTPAHEEVGALVFCECEREVVDAGDCKQISDEATRCMERLREAGSL